MGVVGESYVLLEPEHEEEQMEVREELEREEEAEEGESPALVAAVVRIEMGR